MAKIWDDPDADVNGMIDEFFRLYFGPAGEPMKKFYLRLEEIAGDPRNYPVPYHRPNGIDWKGVAWDKLGTEERMDELHSLIAQAERLTGTDMEKHRVTMWRTALWEWMRQGQEERLARQR